MSNIGSPLGTYSARNFGQGLSSVVVDTWRRFFLAFRQSLGVFWSSIKYFTRNYDHHEKIIYLNIFDLVVAFLCCDAHSLYKSKKSLNEMDEKCSSFGEITWNSFRTHIYTTHTKCSNHSSTLHFASLHVRGNLIINIIRFIVYRYYTHNRTHTPNKKNPFHNHSNIVSYFTRIVSILFHISKNTLWFCWKFSHLLLYFNFNSTCFKRWRFDDSWNRRSMTNNCYGLMKYSVRSTKSHVITKFENFFHFLLFFVLSHSRILITCFHLYFTFYLHREIRKCDKWFFTIQFKWFWLQETTRNNSILWLIF